MAGDAFLIRDGPVAVPLAYSVPNQGEMLPLSIRATLDGSASGQAFYAVVQLVAPSGRILGNWITEPIAAGASADVTWFPGAELDQETGAVAGGGITSLTSPGATIAVTAPNGPATSIDLPASGVVAGTYGDGTHVPELQVNAEGVVTSVSNVAISGSSFFTTLFDQTLGGSAASIDTGAGGVAGGYSALQILIIGRADGAFFSGSFALQFNNDSTAANYQYIWTDNSNGTSSSFISTSTGAIKTMEGPGASIGAGIFGVATVTIPGYAQTTANKAATALGGFAETSGHSELVHLVGTWNNNAAITRIKLFTGIGNLVAGSRMTIYGLP